MEEKKLFLIDAYALIYRAYYALIRAPRFTAKGFNTSAIFGFCNTLDEVLRNQMPTHIAVCFDPSGPTFRHEEYPEYKANRDKQPEDITLAVPYIKKILQAMNIEVIERSGYEADDIIGTLSRMAENQGFTTYMMTLDKDYGQLVTDRVLMYRPSLRGEGFEVRGPREVCQRYGIDNPRQVIDLLALEGDASDNIPGCPGVGEKTAVKLIHEFGSVENLIAGSSSLTGALKNKIADNADKIMFSKRLVTICTDVPLDGVNPEQFARKPENVDALVEIYRELEFRSFIKKLTGGEESNGVPRKASASAAPTQGSLFDFDSPEPLTPAVNIFRTLATVEHEYTVVTTPAEVEEAMTLACGCAEVAVSESCSGNAEPMLTALCGIAIALSPTRAFYIQLPAGRQERAEIFSALQPLFGSHGPEIIGGDVKRTMLLLRREGIVLANDYFDVGVAHYLVEPEVKHDLHGLASRFLDYEMAPVPKAVKGSCAPDADLACESACVALELAPKLRAQIDTGGLAPLMTQVEMPLVRVLAMMEWTGVRVDVAELGTLSARYGARLTQMEEEAYALAGCRFNVSSPMQVGEVLFERLKIDPKAKKTKKGAYSTTEEVLEKYRHDNPLVDLILRIRALKKLLATYIDALPELVNPVDGKIHTSYNQTVTATGRISSTNPNLQNIPVRSDDGKEIRKAFVPSEGNIMLAADYSQIELRLMADMSGDQGMIDAFLCGADFHRATAAKIYHELLGEVTDEQRRNAKTANFGIIYGISAFGLSERLGIPRGEAKALIEGYFRTYPGVKAYMEKSVETAREKGYVTTVMGRRRMLADINSRNAVVRGYAERNAINAPLQGSAADIIKLAMVNIAAEMERLQMKSTMIMQVHDELVFDVTPDELDDLKRLVVRFMERAFRGSVPMEVSVGTGLNWLQAH